MNKKLKRSFLAAGIALALFFGNAVCAWYIGLFA